MRNVSCGQVAQMVERSPEKAGVGGSIPSLATMISKHLCEIPWIGPAHNMPTKCVPALNH